MTAPLTPALGALVTRAYARYECTPPRNLGVCLECCMPRDVERAILRSKPEDMTLSQLREWLYAAGPAVMPDGICRFMLPRALASLAYDEDLDYVDKEPRLKRFAAFMAADRQVYPLLDDFMEAYLAAVIPSEIEYLDDILCMFTLGGWDVAQLSGVVFAQPPEVLIERLWRDWCGGKMYPSVWHTAYWPKGQSAHAIYSDPRLEGHINAVILDDASSEARIARACDVSDVLQHLAAP